MASDREYTAFVLDQLSLAEDVSFRPMMGETIIYCRGRIIGGVYDNRFLVKPVKAALSMIEHPRMELPYEGAKEMVLVEEMEDRVFLKRLAEAVANEVPLPKRRKKQGGEENLWNTFR